MFPASAPKVSVVVVNWNLCELLRSCLNSLLRQSGVGFEILVIDNGSADGSACMVAELARSSPVPLRLIENTTNRGFCAANNQGFAASQGAFIAVLNNDAEADPGWLQALLSGFHGRPDVGMAASKILSYEDPRRIDKAGHLIYPDGQNRGRGAGEIDAGQYDRVEEVLWPDGCAAMYRRAMLDQIGGFDEDFFAYADDAELGLRARIAGWNCLYVPAAVVRHHRGATLGLQSTQRLELIERNRLLLATKLFPWSLLWLNVPYAAARVAAGAWAAARHRGESRRYSGVGGKLRVAGALLRGALRAVPLMPRMLRKRREIERLRKLSPSEVRRLILSHRISLRALAEESL